MTSKEDLGKMYLLYNTQIFFLPDISSHSAQYTLSLSSTHFVFYIILAFLCLLSKFILDFKSILPTSPGNIFIIFAPMVLTIMSKG